MARGRAGVDGDVGREGLPIPSEDGGCFEAAQARGREGGAGRALAASVMRRRWSSAPFLEGPSLEAALEEGKDAFYRVLAGRRVRVEDIARIVERLPPTEMTQSRVHRTHALEALLLHLPDAPVEVDALLALVPPVRRPAAQGVLDTLPPVTERAQLLLPAYQALYARVVEAGYFSRVDVLLEHAVGRRFSAIQLRELLCLVQENARLELLHRLALHWNRTGAADTVLSVLPAEDRRTGAALLEQTLTPERFSGELCQEPFVDTARAIARAACAPVRTAPKAPFLASLRGQPLSPVQLEEALRLLSTSPIRLRLLPVLALQTDGGDLRDAIRRVFLSPEWRERALEVVEALPPRDPQSLSEPDYQALVAHLMRGPTVDLDTLEVGLTRFGRPFSSQCQWQQVLHLMPENLESEVRALLAPHAPA